MCSAGGDRVSPRSGCPIRTPSDHRAPAAPRGVSSPGHVLLRPQTPRHPPCALLAVLHPPFRHRNGTGQPPACTHHAVVFAFAFPSDPSKTRPRQTCRASDAGNASFRMLLPCAHLLRCSGGAEGIRTPDLRRAKAALSRLSYSPIVKMATSGRSWTRTTGLTLIRGVLSPTELNALSRHLGR